MHRLGAHFHQEACQTVGGVRVAEDGEPLAVDVGVAVGDGIDQTAALQGQFGRDRLAGQLASFIRNSSVAATPTG